MRGKAAANGVDDLAWLDAPAVHALEPELRAVAALLSPSTGIIDSHGLMLSYQGDAETAGAMLALRSPLLGARLGNDGFRLEVGGDAPMALNCRYLVNAAGLEAQAVARALQGFDPRLVPARHLAKGNYFVLGRPRPLSPSDLSHARGGGAGRSSHPRSRGPGSVRAGCGMDRGAGLSRRSAARGAASTPPSAAIGRACPTARWSLAMRGSGPSSRGRAGRPRISSSRVRRSMACSSSVNLFGIESPGLTASLAIAELVLRELQG